MVVRNAEIKELKMCILQCSATPLGELKVCIDQVMAHINL